ncbi:MAG: ABC transporter permease [Planctomycetota bacterium]|nr:ABC transporter permease [Planctomycetota bacterium]
MKKFLHSRFVSEYGSVFVLLILCAYYSAATVAEQNPITPRAGRDLARAIVSEHGDGASVLIVVRDTNQDREFAAAIRRELEAAGATVLATVAGDPSSARQALEKVGTDGSRLDAIATHHPGSVWGPLETDRLAQLAGRFPGLRDVRVHKPPSYTWPSFLTRENLLNVVNQNADIAIIAIGMTLVIITAGIDLSVGSLLAFAGVMTAVAIQQLAGGASATTLGMIGGSLVGIGLCALLGTFSGCMVTIFRVPAFVVTLGMMMVARGLALIIAVRHQSGLVGGATEGTPEAVKIEAVSFEWLGNGELLGIPNPIVLMVFLYVVAHIVMSRTSFGRYVYAVGGNAEAARLSGVPVVGVLIVVYAVCGAMAGLAGVVDASRFEGGRPNGGELYELRVIAAVVVGGTSLAGGEGRIFGTLIGALIIAVIQNGLNMAGVKSYEQKVVFGLLILAAVLVDQLKKRKKT